MIHIHAFGTVTNWLIFYGFVLGSSYLFYLMIERPHLRARKIKVTPHPKMPDPLDLKVQV
jgi:hypothetical protein